MPTISAAQVAYTAYQDYNVYGIEYLAVYQGHQFVGRFQPHDSWIARHEDQIDVQAGLDDREEVLEDECECDNTHTNNKTVCRHCWEKGIRFQYPKEVADETL